jgi:drug/metabolite transporter (DMT)-like permease
MSWRGWMVFLALCVVWGIPYFFIKLALEEFSPACVAWSRAALGAAVLLPIAWKRGVLRPAMAHKRAILAFTLCEMVIPLFLIALGERWITSSLAGILVATLPIIVALLSPLFGLSERLGPRRLTGLAVGFAGVIALLGLDKIQGPEQWAGVACLFVATVGYAVGPLIVERHLRGVDELGAVTVSLLVAAVVLLPTAALSAPTHLPSALAVLSLIVLGVVCTAGGMILYFYLIVHAGAARAAVITYINPAVAALLGVFILREPFGLGSAAGLILILLGSALATSRSAHPEPASGSTQER